ncbi:hypothetical protein F5887DRAFT_916431 [Amanita rubescens]|nr:hypothetical protein F5887DRAFT_916431 [Amanita rubescens]
MVPAGGDTAADSYYRPHIHITGVVDTVDPKVDFWDMCPQQYVQNYATQLKDGDSNLPAGTRPANPCLPVRVVVPNTNQWAANRKPKTRVGSIIAVSGFISGFDKDAQTGQHIRILVELEKVTYLGALPTAPQSGEATPKAKKGKGRFSYSNASPAPKRVKQGPDMVIATPGSSGSAMQA